MITLNTPIVFGVGIFNLFDAFEPEILCGVYCSYTVPEGLPFCNMIVLNRVPSEKKRTRPFDLQNLKNCQKK